MRKQETRKRLNDTDIKLVVAMENIKKRGEVAKFFAVDPTVIDRIWQGHKINPNFPDEKWCDLSIQKKNELVSRIESGEMSMTSVVNGWRTTRKAIESHIGRTLKTPLKAGEDDSDMKVDLEDLKKVVKNCKKMYYPICGDTFYRVIVNAVLEACEK